jgi:hypothetical protein
MAMESKTHMLLRYAMAAKDLWKFDRMIILG